MNTTGSSSVNNLSHFRFGGSSESSNVDNETGFGLSTGLAIGIGENFAIQLGLRYLDASAEAQSASSSEELGVDPLFHSLGFAFRF